MIAACLAASPGAAGERAHGAHVHGIGQMNLAWEGETVEIELIAPGADVVGFEHSPATPEEEEAVAEGVRRLQDATLLFVFPADAGCALEEADVASAMLHPHDDEAHEHAHGEEHAHENEHPHGDMHAEFRAHYRFRCDRPDALSELTVTFFSAFPSAEALNVQMVTPKGQESRTLTAKDARLWF